MKNILVIKMSSMGDVLHALPAICLLRDRLPEARITWLIDDRFAELVAGHTAIDEFLVARAPRWMKRLGPVEHIGRGAAHLTASLRLAERQFDMVIDLQGLFKTGVLAAATRAPARIGFANAREAATLFYTNAEKVPLKLHAVSRCIRLVETLVGPADRVRFDLPVAASSCAAAERWLASRQIAATTPFVVLAPQSSRSEKNWPVGRFAGVVEHLQQRWQLPTVVIGGEKDRLVCQEIVRTSASSAHALIGESLDTVVAILQRCRLMIGPDSGPIHIAAALARPVVSIFGPTDPVRFAPWGSEDLVVQANTACPACQVAAVAGHLTHHVVLHSCMNKLTLETVTSAVDRELQRLQRNQPRLAG